MEYDDTLSLLNSLAFEAREFHTMIFHVLQEMNFEIPCKIHWNAKECVNGMHSNEISDLFEENDANSQFPLLSA